MSGFPPSLFVTCTTRPSRAWCLSLPANLPSVALIGCPMSIPLVLVLYRLSHVKTVGPCVFPQKSRSPRPADWKKGEVNIAGSPSILMALLICCSVRLPPTLWGNTWGLCWVEQNGETVEGSLGKTWNVSSSSERWAWIDTSEKVGQARDTRVHATL